MAPYILPSVLVRTGLRFPCAGCSFRIESSSSIVSLSIRHFTAEIGFQMSSTSDWSTNRLASRKPFWISQFHYQYNKSYREYSYKHHNDQHYNRFCFVQGSTNQFSWAWVTFVDPCLGKVSRECYYCWYLRQVYTFWEMKTFLIIIK